jgi:NADPH:quinone reductase-like Zn-dependent oxidoreductase
VSCKTNRSKQTDTGGTEPIPYQEDTTMARAWIKKELRRGPEMDEELKRERDAAKPMPAEAIESYGDLDQIIPIELPIPFAHKSHEILIRMQGAEVGNWDAMVCRGEWPMGRDFPLILGLAGAGTVAAVGTQVRDFELGDVAYAYSYPLYDNGAWAKYMLVDASYAAWAPRTLDVTKAGAVPIVGLTAHETITDILNVQRGDLVLITAAAGGVGHIAVQLAAQRGAHVVATASARNHLFLQSLGAAKVIDYMKDDVVEELRERYPAGFDKVLNCVAGELAERLQNLVRTGGHMIDLTQSIQHKRRGIKVNTDYSVKANGERLGRISRLIDEGRLKIEVQDIFPLERARHALDVVLEGHVRGKIALRIS